MQYTDYDFEPRTTSMLGSLPFLGKWLQSTRQLMDSTHEFPVVRAGRSNVISSISNVVAFLDTMS